jgi:predicted dehydrogenase
VVHAPVAVASRSAAKAEKFIVDFGNGVQGVRAYGSYAEIFADPNVDIVYIGVRISFCELNLLCRTELN